MAVIPEDVPECGRVTLGAQLAAVVGAKQGPGEDSAALVAQLLEGQGTVEAAVLEESGDPIPPPADARVTLRHSSKHRMNEAIEGGARGLIVVLGTAIQVQLAHERERSVSDQSIRVEAGFLDASSNTGQFSGAADAADPRGPARALHNEEGRGLDFSNRALGECEYSGPHR